MHMTPEAEKFFADSVLETRNNAHRHYHHCHAKARGKNGETDDERRKTAFLLYEVTARYEKWEIHPVDTVSTKNNKQKGASAVFVKMVYSSGIKNLPISY